MAYLVYLGMWIVAGFLVAVIFGLVARTGAAADEEMRKELEYEQRLQEASGPCCR